MLDNYMWRDEIDRQVRLDEIANAIGGMEDPDEIFYYMDHLDIDLNYSDKKYISSKSGYNVMD